MTEQELAGGAARRLAIIRHAQEVTGNVSLPAGTTGSPTRPTASGFAATRRAVSRGSGTDHAIACSLYTPDDGLGIIGWATIEETEQLDARGLR
jgi:hypothetical protein